jgi:rhodanese-related sulfurtransferase
MKRNTFFLLALLGACLLSFTFANAAEVSSAAAGPRHAAIAVAGEDAVAGKTEATISPEDLVKALKLPAKQQPLVLNVGPHTLYLQSHIPGAEYIAPGSNAQFNAALETRMKSVPHGKFVVIYCGCCPWIRCPNIHPALAMLQARGFTNVKMLYIADNFGNDWVYKGYPATKGE